MGVLVAFAGVVLLGTLKGIMVAIIVSLVALAYQVADPPVYMLVRMSGTNIFRPRSKEYPNDESFPGLLLVRVEGRIFFANAEQIGHKLRALIDETHPRVVALHMRGVPDLEFTALKMFTEAAKRHRERGIRLWLVGTNPQVLEVSQRSPPAAAIGPVAIHPNLETAVAQYIEESG